MENMMRLSGREPWVIAGQGGATVWVRRWGDKNFSWPIVDVELDCGLIGIDVCGMREVWDLADCAEIRIENDTLISQDDFYKVFASG
jgi:hypothetical protein